jgi:hypothetical protein
MKTKSSKVRIVYILFIEAFDLIREECFGGEGTFIFFEGSSSSLGGVTSPLFYSTSMPSISLPSPPCTGDMEAVFVELLLTS